MSTDDNNSLPEDGNDRGSRALMDSDDGEEELPNETTRIIRLQSDVLACKTGEELLLICRTIPSSGKKYGKSLVMNRIIAALKVLSPQGALSKYPAWAQCNPIQQKMVEAELKAVSNPVDLDSMQKAVLGIVNTKKKKTPNTSSHNTQAPSNRVSGIAFSEQRAESANMWSFQLPVLPSLPSRSTTIPQLPRNGASSHNAAPLSSPSRHTSSASPSTVLSNPSRPTSSASVSTASFNSSRTTSSAASSFPTNSLPRTSTPPPQVVATVTPSEETGGGRVVDRVALLAHALADPHLTPMWQRLYNPVPDEERPAMLDYGMNLAQEERWDKFAEEIMTRREQYCNIRSEVVFGKYGRLLRDVAPENGVFRSTRALTAGKQLKAFATHMRSQYSILNDKLDRSGLNNANNTVEAYERTGLVNRPKDVGLFYFWLVLFDKDIDFFVATLFPDEEAKSDGEEESACSAIVEQAGSAQDPGEGSSSSTGDSARAAPQSAYAKRKDAFEKKQEAARKKEKRESMEMLAEVMTGSGTGSEMQPLDLQLKESQVNKNNAAVKEKEEVTKLYASKVVTEEVDRIAKVVNNPALFNLLKEDEKSALKHKLCELMGLK